MVTLTQIVGRLSQLGYTPKDMDSEQVQFELDLILDYVVNYCNFTSVVDIPPILDKRIVDRVCAEYLMKKKNAGQLEGFDYDAFVKTVKEGDTQIQYGNSSDGETPESRFDDFCNKLERGFDKWCTKWRRLKW